MTVLFCFVVDLSAKIDFSITACLQQLNHTLQIDAPYVVNMIKVNLHNTAISLALPICYLINSVAIICDFK